MYTHKKKLTLKGNFTEPIKKIKSLKLFLLVLVKVCSCDRSRSYHEHHPNYQIKWISKSFQEIFNFCETMSFLVALYILVGYVHLKSVKSSLDLEYISTLF